MEIHPSNPRFFFFFVSRVAACFYVSSGLCQTPYGVITHPIKQHAIDHSGTATRNSESQTIEFVASFRCHRFQLALSFLPERLIFLFFLFHHSTTNIELLLSLAVRDSETCCHSTRKRYVIFGTKQPREARYFIFASTFFFHRKYRIIRFFIQNARLINPSLEMFALNRRTLCMSLVLHPATLLRKICQDLHKYIPRERTSCYNVRYRQNALCDTMRKPVNV